VSKFYKGDLKSAKKIQSLITRNKEATQNFNQNVPNHTTFNSIPIDGEINNLADTSITALQMKYLKPIELQQVK
jgi:hypothetical protein